MASSYNGPIQGLYARHGFFKSIFKGEDAWIQKPGLKAPTGCETRASTTVDLFGVFDGHGGKQAATYASRHLQDVLMDELRSAAAPASKELPPNELKDCKQLSKEDWLEWEYQEQLVAKLPAALTKAFAAVHESFLQATKESGTTATAVALVGWDLVVANVGDSCAFLDTGSEVRQVSGNHRLEDNKAEQERIRKEGFEVSPSTVEGKPCGPLRVWPGGLAMSRSLGDFESGQIVLHEPDIRQVTLPATGARVVVASDGLWDAVTPKTALHHVRGMPANKAARELVAAALKAKGLKDDITVLVIDAVPSEEHKQPPQMTKDGSGQLQAQAMQVPSVIVQQPLLDAEPSRSQWQRLLWQRRLEAVQSAFPEAFHSADETKITQSGADSMESCGTALAADAESGYPGHTESAEEHSDATSDGSEAFIADLGNNPFALAGVELDEEDPGQTGSWETVPAKGCMMPNRRRKHPLPPSRGSPTEPVQLPKAPREAPPSPAASPMQTSEMGSAPKDVNGMARRSAPNGGRGRSGRGRGRSRWNGNALPPGEAPRHIDGFKIPHNPPVPPTQTSDMHFTSGLTFRGEGGFTLESIQFGTMPPEATFDGPFSNVVPLPDSAASEELKGSEERKKGLRPRWRGRGRGRGANRMRTADAIHTQLPEEQSAGSVRGRGRGRRPFRGRGSHDGQSHRELNATSHP